MKGLESQPLFHSWNFALGSGGLPDLRLGAVKGHGREDEMREGGEREQVDGTHVLLWYWEAGAQALAFS